MKEVIVFLLVVNALFWALSPRSLQCRVVSYFTNAKCPPHIFHIIFGVLSFTLAILIAQHKYITDITNEVMRIFDYTSKIAVKAGKISSKAVKKMPSVEEFTSKIEKYVDKM